MERKVFIEKINLLFREFNEGKEDKEEYEFFLFATAPDGSGFHGGYGCPACSAARITLAATIGLFKHNDETKNILLEAEVGNTKH